MSTDDDSVLTGRLMYRRPLSKKLVFYDFDELATGRSFEIMLKSTEDLTTEHIKNLRDTLKEARSEDSRSEGGDRQCKFWLNTGICPKRNVCPYEHGETERVTEARAEWIALRRRRQEYLSADSMGIHDANPKRKSARARVFGQWLVDKFGKETLGSGSGVLDIAGGRGSLAFELQIVHGIPTLIVDPRTQKLTRAQHRMLGQNESTLGVPPQILAEFQEELWREDSPQGCRIRNCSIVVGMHPDQATDAIVDFAMEQRKSFAVIPCCVFPRIFPHRMIDSPNGNSEQVVTYTQLVQYLTQKADAATEYLGFIGMNQAVFKQQQ